MNESSIHWFLSLMLETPAISHLHQAEIRSLELHLGVDGRDPCLLQHVSRRLNQKWSNWKSNHYSDRACWCQKQSLTLVHHNHSLPRFFSTISQIIKATLQMTLLPCYKDSMVLRVLRDIHQGHIVSVGDGGLNTHLSIFKILPFHLCLHICSANWLCSIWARFWKCFT